MTQSLSLNDDAAPADIDAEDVDYVNCNNDEEDFDLDVNAADDEDEDVDDDSDHDDDDDENVNEDVDDSGDDADEVEDDDDDYGDDDEEEKKRRRRGRRLIVANGDKPQRVCLLSNISSLLQSGSYYLKILLSPLSRSAQQDLWTLYRENQVCLSVRSPSNMTVLTMSPFWTMARRTWSIFLHLSRASLFL